MTLDDLLAAIVIDEAEALRLIAHSPALAIERVGIERLVPEVPHQLYAGDTALHLASAALQPAIVLALLDARADPNAENRRGAIALHYACDPRPMAGKSWNPPQQRRVIEHLVDRGSRIDAIEKSGASPLHRAVRARSPEAVRCLLERGASVHARHGKQGSTPLHMALHSTGASGTKGARAEQDEIVALLLQHGADPEAKDANGKTPPPTKSRRAR
jgi:ankyrin repeat protein